jgi:hypothetical protein
MFASMFPGKGRAAGYGARFAHPESRCGRALAAGILLAAALGTGGQGRAAVPQGTDPAIEVSPPSLSVEINIGQTQTEDLTIANNGGGSLDWNVPGTDPTAFSRIGAIDLGDDGGVFKSALIDATGHYAYFGTTVPGRIFKVDLETGQPAGSVTLPDGEIQLWSAVMDPAGAFGYFATNAQPAQLLKIDLATLDQVDTAALDGNVRSAVLDPSGNFVYLGTNTSPGMVLKVDLASFQQVASITLEAGENKLNSAVIDPAGQFAYFGTSTSPGQVVKIDLGSFTRSGALALEVGENNLQSAVIDPAGAYAYFGTNTVPGQLVKVDLAGFTRVGVAPADAEEAHFTAGLIDPAGTAAYFSTSAGPAEIVKFDLATFSRVAAVTLEDGENFVGTGVMDPAGRFAWFPATTDPVTLASRVVKIGLQGQDCALPAWASVDPAAGSVAPGGSQVAGVTFDATAQDPGDYAATLCIASNDPVQPLVTVPLALSVTASTAAPVLSFTPTAIDFGDVEVGDTSPVRAATLHNTGNAQATSLAFSDPSGSGFDAATNACGDALAAGASCVVAVTFTPAATGAVDATLEVDSAEGASAGLDLAGNGIPPTPPPAIAIDPGALDATLEPDQMASLGLTIANLGVETLDWQVGTLPGFRRIDRINLAHTDYVAAAVIDPAGQYAYFGGSEEQRGDTITKVDLATYEEVTDIETDGFDYGYTSAVVDPAGHYA